MGLDIVLISKDIQSADAEDKFKQALRIIAELILQGERKEKPRTGPGPGTGRPQRKVIIHGQFIC